jgi:hypothetical protein
MNLIFEGEGRDLLERGGNGKRNCKMMGLMKSRNPSNSKRHVGSCCVTVT